jgi:hypothetical protein
MRQFLRMACAPSALTCSVSARPAVALLVAPTCALQRLTPANPRTLSRTVLLAAITSATNAHVLRAAPAAVQPIGLLACSHAPARKPLDNAADCGHKGKANASSCRASMQKARGFLPGNVPGPSLIRRPDLRIATGEALEVDTNASPSEQSVSCTADPTHQHVANNSGDAAR